MILFHGSDGEVGELQLNGLQRAKSRFVMRSLHLVACLVVALLMPSVGLAQSDAGSLTLLLGDGSGQPTTDMVGGAIALYNVAGVRQDASAYDVSRGQFSSSDAVAGIPAMSKGELDERNAELSAQLEKEAAANNLQPLKTTAIEGGRATFEGLSRGLYLLLQSEPSEGGRKMNTFLISLPDESGAMEVVAHPKPGITDPSDPSGSTKPAESPNSQDSRSGSADSAVATQAPAIGQRVAQTADVSVGMPMLVAFAAAGCMAVGLGMAKRKRCHASVDGACASGDEK